ncbi:hypothetical protein KY285_020669 [Solanum tuberosum]|nr:hypothetical protein KY285_020669 [Solanum tuberosum]
MDNAIVKSWLVGAIEPDIMSLFARLSTAKSIWDTVSQTYYERADRSVIYELSCQAMRMKQGKTVSTYFADLRKIWKELDHRKPISFTQPDVVQARQKEIEKERVYIFLAGLDDIYDRVRSDILRANPFSNPESVIAMVQSEEQRRNAMLNNNTNSKMDMAAKLHGYPNWWNGLNENKSREQRDRKDGDKNDGKVVAMVSTITSLPTAETTLTLDGLLTPELLNMTFDQSLLQAPNKPHRSHMSNANGVSSPVTSARTDLNSKEIIGCGTKRGGSIMWMMYVMSYDMDLSTEE